MDSFKHLQYLISPKLTWEVFEKVLKKQHNCEQIQLIDITFGKPARKGDSYLSTITRFSVEYSGELSGGGTESFKLHVIAKSLLRNIAQRKTFRNTDFFTNETVFYKDVWSQLNAFQKDIKPNELFAEIPNFLCGEFDGTNDYILLEDLSFQGYQTVDRSGALTFERTTLVLKILSRFHALGYAFSKAKPDMFIQTASKLKDTYFHENIRTWYAKFHENLCDITLDAVQKELPEFYGTKLKEVFTRDLYGETVELCSPAASSKFKTITHGDTWLPNFLTRYNDSKQPLHSVMIDFQLARYSSCAQDLHFFIYACTDAELRAERYEDMLKYYCQEFNGFFAQLCPEVEKNGPALSYDALVDELMANGSFALCMGMEASIMSMLDDDEVSDMGSMEGQDAVPLESVWIVKPLKTKEKSVKLAQIIKHMIDYKYI